VPDIHQRLTRCFQAVFPGLGDDETAKASSSSVVLWDSLATVTLAAALEEEFGIQFEAEEIEKINSFQSCLKLLATHLPPPTEAELPTGTKETGSRR
jgi:acyl carrier protein